LPSRTSGRLDGMLSNIIVTRPPSRSGIAVARPLYGMCSMSMPVIVLKSSPDTWIDVPEPDDAKLIFPSFLPSAMNSFSVFAGTLLFTTSMFGVVASSVTGAKSLTVSYGIFAYSAALMACVPTVPTTIV
jgi:hypothetical protein